MKPFVLTCQILMVLISVFTESNSQVNYSLFWGQLWVKFKFVLRDFCIGIKEKVIGEKSGSCMLSLTVVKLHVSLDSFVEIHSSVWRAEIDIFIFERPPKALNVNIVKCSSFSIHWYLYLAIQQRLNKRGTGELTTLICIKYFRLPFSTYSIQKDLSTPPHRRSDPCSLCWIRSSLQFYGYIHQ